MILSALRISPKRLFSSTAGIILAALFAVISGCGGGTTGTGGTGSSQFAGRIISADGDPIVNATVTIAETGDATVSDSEGNFSIESDSVAPTATLLVETSDTSVSAPITELPAGPKEVDVELKLDKSAKTLTVESKQVKPRKPTRTPTPVVVPTLAPTETAVPATPTAAPTSEPPTATPEASPTPEPQPTLAASPTVIAVTPRPLTRIRGQIQGDLTLIGRARIGLAGGTSKFNVKDDGTFNFLVDVGEINPGLEISVGKRSTIVVLDSVKPGTVRIVLTLSLSQASAGTPLHVEILAARITG